MSARSGEYSYGGSDGIGYKSPGVHSERGIATVRVVFPSDSPVPTSIDAELTIGTSQPSQTYTFNTSGYSPGDEVVFTMIEDASDLESGIHTAIVDIQATYTGFEEPRGLSLNEPWTVINRKSSQIAPDWSFNFQSKLYTQGPNASVVSGNNQVSRYSASTNGSYRGQDGVNSRLAPIDNGGHRQIFTDRSYNEFDSDGNQTKSVDANGNETTFAYTNDRLDSVTDPNGRTTSYQYSGNQLTSSTDFANRVTTYTKTSSKLTITHPDPDGVSGTSNTPEEEFHYNSKDQMYKYVDPEGNETTYTFDPNTGSPTRVTFADQSYWTITTTDTNTHDALAEYPKQLTPENITTLLNANAFTTRRVDAEGNETIQLLDSFGNEVGRKDAEGSIFISLRDDDGHVIKSIMPDPDGSGPLGDLTTDYERDERGNIIRILHPFVDGERAVEVWEFNKKFDIPSKYIDPVGNVTIWGIDNDTGNITSEQVLGTSDAVETVTNPADWQNGVNRFDVNDDGVVSYADIEAITVELKNRDYIDAYGELPASFTGRFYYDVNGDDYVTPTDFLEIAPLITSSTFEHTFEYTEGGSIPDGLLERSTDPLGRVVEYDYYTSEPNKGWLKTVTELMSTVGDVSDDIERIHYTSYDSAGNVTESEDALGIATAYEYDALDRLTKIKVVDPYGSATATPTTTFESFEYDMNSNLTKHTDGEGLVTKTNYDDRNRVEDVTVGFGSGIDLTTEYLYDDNGNLEWLKTPDSTSGTNDTQFIYDDLNRLTEIRETKPFTTSPQPVTTYYYDKLGNQTAVEDAEGNVTQYLYDARNRLEYIVGDNPDPAAAATDPQSVVTPQSVSSTRPVTQYEYDEAGRTIAMIDPIERRTEYEYDTRGLLRFLRLPELDTNDGITTDVPVYEYQYDLAGNLRFEIDPLGSTTEHEYDDRNNRIFTTLADPNSQVSNDQPVFEFEYNDVGLLEKAIEPVDQQTQLVTEYVYDNLHRLQKTILPESTNHDPANPASSTLGHPETEQRLDLAGNLLAMADPLDNTTHYIYDDLHRPLYEIREDRDATTKTSLTATFTTSQIPGLKSQRPMDLLW